MPSQTLERMPLINNRDNDGNVTKKWVANEPTSSINIPLGGADLQSISHIEDNIAAVVHSPKYPFESEEQIAAYIANQIQNTTLDLNAMRILKKAKLSKEARVRIEKRIQEIQEESDD